MMKVSQILTGKSTNLVYAVHPDQMVIEALELMAARNIGAVMVMEGAQLVGIFSERDYARKGILQERKAKSTPVSEVMTPNVITVGSKSSIEDCMRLMSERHFRHLPVVDDGQVVGLVSISDVVKVIIEEQKGRIENLEKYITGY
jgi:CBS domain-containing protein